MLKKMLMIAVCGFGFAYTADNADAFFGHHRRSHNNDCGCGTTSATTYQSTPYQSAGYQSGTSYRPAQTYHRQSIYYGASNTAFRSPLNVGYGLGSPYGGAYRSGYRGYGSGIGVSIGLGNGVGNFGRGSYGLGGNGLGGYGGVGYRGFGF